jgi:ankyrin repeat protein
LPFDCYSSFIWPDTSAQTEGKGLWDGSSESRAARRYPINTTVDSTRLLLDKSADVNAQGIYYSNALEAASARGHEAVVGLLLDKGVDVNAQGIYYSDALQAASARGQEVVVRLLLDKGADINAQSRCYGNALQAASIGGYEAVVTLLLDRGAITRE